MPPTLAVEQKTVAKLLKLYHWLKQKKWEDGSVRFVGDREVLLYLNIIL